MSKRILSIVVVLCLMISCTQVVLGAGGGKGNLIINGDFEKFGSNGTPANWTLHSGAAEALTEGVHGGNSALIMSHTENMYLSQQLRIVAGEFYEISFWARLGENNNNGNVRAAIKWEGYNTAGENSFNNVGEFEITYAWAKYEFTCSSPADASYVNFLLRLYHGGEIYIDDLKCEGRMPENFSSDGMYVIKKDAKSIPADYVRESIDGKEYFENPGFEKGDTKAEGWNAVGGKWGEDEAASYITDASHSGNACVRIHTTSGGNPWVSQHIKDLMPGATYQLTGWYNADVTSASILCKMEFYSSNVMSVESSINSSTTLYYGTTNGDWRQLITEFIMPENGQSVVIYPRLMAPSGTVYFDDMSLVLVEAPPISELKTDDVFYYTGTKTGYATLTLREEAAENMNVVFTLADEKGATVKTETAAFSQNKFANFRFEPDSFVKQAEYTLTAEIKNEAGETLETQSQYVYRYDRPTAIGEDGIYYADGKPFYPTIIYHAGAAYKELAKIGVNVIQGSNYSPDEYITVLDEANKYGMKILITLYPGMKPAGSDVNRERTIEIVNKVKDHPAVFAYAIQDEPWAHNPDCGDDLRKSYKLIRDIDPVHPVYLCECFENKFEESGKYVDTLCIDPYPFNAGHVGTRVADYVALAQKAVDYKKPIYVLSSVLTFSGFRPEGYEIRTQFYQTLFEGGVWGMYPYNPDDAKIDKLLPDSIFWEHLLSFYEKEAKLFEEYFYLKMYPTFNKGAVDTARYESFVKDGKLYMAVYNTTREPVDVTIPLVSQNGKVTAKVTSISVVNGADKLNAKASAEGIDVSLSATQAVLYCITLSGGIDTKALEETRFNDIEAYGWAKDAIYTLEKKDIANGEDTFAPGEAITRGDFAMFLIKSLGLSMASGENFADVEQIAEYAESIDVGRTMGILNGVGDNKYLPEMQISRQDLMTIIARGLGLSGNADLSGYSDSDMIADYARESISAMVAAGLITGNADGTLNPLGNATRAEAAVIMQRIMSR